MIVLGHEVIYGEDRLSLEVLGIEIINISSQRLGLITYESKTFETKVAKLGDIFSDWEFKCSPVGKCLGRWFILVSRAIMAF